MIPHDMGVCLCQDVNMQHLTRYSEPSTRHHTQWPHSSRTTPTGTAARNALPGCLMASWFRPNGRGSLTYSQRIASLRTRAARSSDTAATQPLARLCWLLTGASSCGARVRCAPAPRCGLVPWSVSGRAAAASPPLPRRRCLGFRSLRRPARSPSRRGAPPPPVPLLQPGAVVCLGGSSWCLVLGGGRYAPF